MIASIVLVCVFLFIDAVRNCVSQSIQKTYLIINKIVQT